MDNKVWIFGKIILRAVRIGRDCPKKWRIIIPGGGQCRDVALRDMVSGHGEDGLGLDYMFLRGLFQPNDSMTLTLLWRLLDSLLKRLQSHTAARAP